MQLPEEKYNASAVRINAGWLQSPVISALRYSD